MECRNKIFQDCSQFVLHFLQCLWDLQWYCERFIILHQEEKDCVNWFDSHKECKYFFYVKDNNVLKKCHFMFRVVCLFIILFSFSSCGTYEASQILILHLCKVRLDTSVFVGSSKHLKPKCHDYYRHRNIYTRRTSILEVY